MMEKLTNFHNKIILIFSVLVVIVIGVLYMYSQIDRVPDGTPNDYYEILTKVNKSGIVIYNYEPNGMLNMELEVNDFNDVDELPRINQNITFIVIDFEKSENLTETDWEYLFMLSEDYCHRIFVANYSLHSSSKIDIKAELYDETSVINHFVIDHDICGTQAFVAYIHDDGENIEQLNYYFMGYLVRNYIDAY